MTLTQADAIRLAVRTSQSLGFEVDHHSSHIAVGNLLKVVFFLKEMNTASRNNSVDHHGQFLYDPEPSIF
jgi:hypothetical protein